MKNNSFSKIFDIHKGFTLAEVLITIAVIGIVAALTLPTLFHQSNDTETITRLKKIYSNLLVATSFITTEEGEISQWDWDTGNNTMDNVIAGYIRHLKFYKTCPYGDVTNCYYESNWKLLNGNSYFDSYPGGGGYYNILNDGTYIKFVKCNAVCGWWVGSNYVPRLYVIVNINGKKPPNIMGRDIFIFVLTDEKGFITPTVNVNNICRSTGNGSTCSAKVLLENAINY